jgi:hypothetical protein
VAASRAEGEYVDARTATLALYGGGRGKKLGQSSFGSGRSTHASPDVYVFFLWARVSSAKANGRVEMSSLLVAGLADGKSRRGEGVGLLWMRPLCSGVVVATRHAPIRQGGRWGRVGGIWRERPSPGRRANTRTRTPSRRVVCCKQSSRVALGPRTQNKRAFHRRGQMLDGAEQSATGEPLLQQTYSSLPSFYALGRARMADPARLLLGSGCKMQLSSFLWGNGSANNSVSIWGTPAREGRHPQ